jgi:general secretion pathway protein I
MTNRARGFTLLEILVALAIVGIVVIGFLRGNSVMIANAEYLRRKTLAHWVAMNRTAEIRLAGQWLTGDGSEGIDLMGDQRWSWKAAGRLSPDPDVQIVTVEVRPADQENSSPLDTLTLFLAKPAATGGTGSPP